MTITSQTAPFPPEFQEQILGWLCRTRRGLLNFGSGTLSSSFFDDGQLSQIWSIVTGHWRTYKTIPQVGSVLEAVRMVYPGSGSKDEDARRAMSDRVRGVYAAPLVEDPFIEQRIRDFVGWCAIRDVILDGAEQIQTGQFDPELAKKLQKAFQASRNDLDLGWEGKRDAIKAIQRYSDPDLNPPIPTGMLHLDAILGGGMRRQQLAMVMAPPKGKKSAFLMNVAANGPTIGNKLNVLYVTLELTEELQSLRFAIRTTQRDKHLMIQDPERYMALYRRRAASIYSPNHDIYFKFFPPYVCTEDTLRAYLDLLQETKGIKIDLMCVDYLELMGSSTTMEKDYMTQVRIITALRQIAVDYDLVMWTASRTNAQAEAVIASGKWITASHTSGSYEKQGVVDASFGLQPYKGDLAIVPVAFRNEAGSQKVHVKADMSRMTLTTVGFIDENEDPDDDAAESDSPRGGGRFQRKKGAVVPRSSVSFGPKAH